MQTTFAKVERKEKSTMMFSVGHMEPFDDVEDDWESYVERFELYAQCNNIVEKKMSATLLTLMGRKA